MNQTTKAVQEMVEWVETHKMTYNSFNELVHEAAQMAHDGNPSWLEALTEAGVATLFTTFCHD